MSFREPKPPCDRNELTSVDESKTISLDFPTPPAASFFEMASYVDAFTANTEGAAFAEDNLPFAFGDYTLEEVVGQGGAGVVFKATPSPDCIAAKNFDVVAVKLIRPEILASPKAVQRFEKESRVHAEIDSDFVTRHLEFGSQGGVYYIASEFVEGVSLNDVIEQLQTLSVKQVLRVVSHILNALDALHQKDIVHRDVKPSNVIVNFSSPTENQAPSFDEFVIAKLTDFGLARHIEQSDSLAITRQQTLLGTPLYMSPEQYFESRSVDARADIYSVGVTLYEMLNGQPPFRADEASELAEMHRIECPIALTSTRQGITEAINNIVMKALEKEPDQRYQTAAEMLADVERVLNDQPIGLRLYPETPDTFDPSVRCYDFQWELAATT